ncbi:MAG: rnc [Chlamydiales bacterium]|jgi:ribonuclease-3|nr:rnc [Chlamydiales bacterium]
MHTLGTLLTYIPDIEKRLDYTFKNRSLLVLAFTHRSFLNEHKELAQEHNERLEFLGDAIFDLLISEFLYKRLPTSPEGELSRLRARLVEASSCYSYIQKLQIGNFVLLGRGEKMNDGRGRESILADLFEALIGAIYLDGGIEMVHYFLFKHFEEDFNATLQQPTHNWKAQLQDYAQKKYQQTPVYEVLEAAGPDHSKNFVVSVFINGQAFGCGHGPSKKEAQQAAAADAFAKIMQTHKQNIERITSG